VRVISIDETTRELRSLLNESFPHTTFEIGTSKTYRSTSLMVVWRGGPNAHDVQAITGSRQGMKFYPASNRRRRVTTVVINNAGVHERVAYEPAFVSLHRLPE
jgi:hypothetical protein